jgi:hypothetical protein
MQCRVSRRRLAGWCVAASLVAAGCLAGPTDARANAPELTAGAATVDAEGVIELVQGRSDLVVLDTRRQGDVDEGRIEGAVRLIDDDLEREFRSFADTMPATASRFEGHSEDVAETARAASGASRAALIVLGADTAGEATTELMVGAGQLGHEATARLARVDAMLDRLRAA